MSWFDACFKFLNSGISEKLIFHKFLINFDHVFYQTFNNLELNEWIDCCNDFIDKGITKKLLFNEKLKQFNYKFYIKFNKDLENLSWFHACSHYINYGIKEERRSRLNINTVNQLNNSKKYNINYKFIHITKTGGTSIEYFFQKLGIKWGKYDTELYKLFKKDGFWHVPINYYEDDYFNQNKFLCIIRNPYERVISEVNYLIKDGYIKQDTNTNKYLSTILSRLLIDNKLNKEFIEDDKLMLRFHFVPMYFYTCFKDFNRVHSNIKIIKFENLNKEFTDFLKDVNIQEEFNVHLNESIKIFKFEDITIKNLRLINKIYKKDFELFNYKMKII
jgi:hypothetical protein